MYVPTFLLSSSLGGRERGRERGKEGGREGRRERGREGEREGGRGRCMYVPTFLLSSSLGFGAPSGDDSTAVGHVVFGGEHSGIVVVYRVNNPQVPDQAIQRLGRGEERE